MHTGIVACHSKIMPVSLKTRIYHQFSHDSHVKLNFTYKYSHDPHIPLRVSTVCDVNIQHIYIYTHYEHIP